MKSSKPSTPSNDQASAPLKPARVARGARAAKAAKDDQTPKPARVVQMLDVPQVRRLLVLDDRGRMWAGGVGYAPGWEQLTNVELPEGQPPARVFPKDRPQPGTRFVLYWATEDGMSAWINIQAHTLADGDVWQYQLPPPVLATAGAAATKVDGE